MSSTAFLSWKRFWCPREGSYRLTEDGYLLDYEIPSYLTDPSIVTLENLFDTRCLILLGEPGIGKSTEMEKHSRFIKERTEATGDEFLKFDLKDYQTDQRLFDVILENPTFKKWQKGENQLYLFLDSFDEALLNINVLSTALPAEIKRLPVERLYFRIASRIADWPINLENELKSIWEKPEEQNVLIYELLPLRKRDVEEFAKANDINSDVFVKRIEERDGQPFAIKPVTLKFLTKIYKRDGDIPKSKKEMYLKGSLHLCTEEHGSRNISKRSGKLTSDQKMKISGRIAALSLFSNKSTIWTGPSKDDCQESDLAKESIYGGQEAVNGIDFVVGPDEVNEALNTGLFSARGQERLGWSHRTYVEFLAAWYLIEHNFEESKILSLISHSGDMNQRLTPQLQETAAWLATFSSRIFDIIKDRNPEVLLRSDVLGADSSVRASLVEALLTMYESGKLFELSWRDFFQYKKLNHSGLANQLRAFICVKTKNFRTRRLAIDLAEECNCLDLLDELVGVALDREDLLAIREQAAHAIMKIGDRNSKSKLITLITSSGDDDSNDELRAYGFMANWPDNLPADELFELISHPKQNGFIGLYLQFLRESVAQHLKLQDLPIALGWVAKSSKGHRMPGDPLSDLMNQIMLLGWNNLDQPGVLGPFSLAALARINNHYGIFSRDISWRMGENFQPLKIIEKDDDKRHILVIEILNLSSRVAFDPLYLIFGQTPLIFRKDFDWLLTTYTRAEDTLQKSAIANWLSRICDSTDTGQISTIYYLYEKDPIFKKEFSAWFDVVEFGSERAIKQKEWFIASQQEEDSSPKLDPPLAERIRMSLEKIEQGDVSSWWILNLDLTIDESTARYGNEFEQDITELPGWKSSDNGFKERIVAAAKRYISEGDPNNKKWWGKNIIYRPAMAGYRALRLVLKENYEDILGLDPKIWKKWASIIFAYPMQSSEKANILDDTLLEVANIYASEEIEKTLLFSIKKENRKNGFVDLNRLNCIWDEKLEAVLMRSLKLKNLQSNLFRTLLGFLLQHHSQSAHDYVIRKVKSYKANRKAEDKEKIEIAIQFLLLYSDNPKWDVVWSVLKEDVELVDSVIAGLGYHHESQKIFNSLSFEQLTELYLFLVRHYLPEEDPKHENEEGLHTITAREEIGRWRDSILNFMANSGDQEACSALRRLSVELPEYEHLQYTLFRAEFNMRQKTWMPLKESELLDLFLKPDTILIESEIHLLEAVIQSLKSLDRLFQGETPEAIYLWNEVGNNIYRPKDENRLSDYVKIHLGKELKQKGIIVNREVEIRRGEETDIRVDAIRKATNSDIYDTVTVIIEVKGCWHRELETAMKSQLKDRYLKNNQCRAGLYMIGWFNCDKWDQTDYRSKDSPKYSMDKAKNHFEIQATNLCTEEILIESYILNLSI